MDDLLIARQDVADAYIRWNLSSGAVTEKFVASVLPPGATLVQEVYHAILDLNFVEVRTAARRHALGPASGVVDAGADGRCCCSTRRTPPPSYTRGASGRGLCTSPGPMSRIHR